jgi:hypothetical protein
VSLGGGSLPWDAATGEAIGADWLLAAIAPSGAFGRAARARERAFRRGDEEPASTAIARVARIASALEAGRLAAVRAAIGGAPDPGALLVRAAAGGILSDVDFFELSRFLEAADDVANLVARIPTADLTGMEAPTCLPPTVGLADPPAEAELRAALAFGRTAERSFYLDDGFDSQLARARGELAAAQAAYDGARSRLGERIARYAGVDRVRDGEFVLMREAVRPPLPPEVRVLREAPTYLLCEVALDEPALAALGARDAAAARVADAEEAVRARLSRQVAASAASLAQRCDQLGELDVLAARAQFAQRYDCRVPRLAGGPRVAFREARYLPLAEALARHGRPYAPVSLKLEGVAVVTGPNMGGKTAALRTLGLLVACVTLGLPVPAAAAEVPLVDAVAWIGIGTRPGTGDDGLLSAFGGEVIALRRFLESDTTRALVLVDEFARTTSPREGRALLVALLETLRERGAVGLTATHLTGIARAAGVPHFTSGGLHGLAPHDGAALDLEAALARIAGAMDYRLTRVEEDAAPAADALALAEALGLPPDVVARAWAALSCR